ncbi:riboflavin synthase-like [Apium graveolens]|uniref:riboflavin synthase-like n=1 Tax=Apium graveolens TaxID=4045 RepID=UPI003D7B3B0A
MLSVMPHSFIYIELLLISIYVIESNIRLIELLLKMSISSACSSTSVSKILNLSPPKASILNSLNSFTHLKVTPNLKTSPSLSLLFKAHNSSFQFTPIKHNQIQSMFTGIVEEVGEIKHIGLSQSNDSSFSIKIKGSTVLQGINLGDSIAINGTCLTVTEYNSKSSEFTVGVSPETLRLTTLTDMEPGSMINLERAVTPTTRMGGHFVQGHVDGTGEIVEVEREGNSLWFKIKTTPEVFKYIVAKGFVAIDGTSLTVVKVFDATECCFNIMMVEYTQQNVVMPLKKVGDKVNLEVDILGKYVEKLLGAEFVGAVNK